ncbi:MAG: NFACT family protein [Beduini sp.]
MSYDGILMYNVVESLKQRLYQGRINKIYQISNYELLIHIRANHTNEKLLISCHPSYARIALTNEKFPTPSSPSQLVMLLRKHLEGSHISKIEQISLDRIMKMTILSRNELGDLVTLYIYVEIMGKHSNFILCNQDHKIIDCLKRISPSLNTVRFLQPGATYEYPPMQVNKLNPLTDGYRLSDNLNKTYLGISPILSRELLFRMEQGTKFEDLMQLITNSKQLYITNVNQKEYFHVIELTHLQGVTTAYELYDGLDQYFMYIDIKERIKQQTSDLEKFILNELNKNKTKLHKLEQTLFESTNSEEYRIKGDLLFASLHLIQKGMNSITVDNYYDGSTLKIELDPRFDGKTNAKRYYTKYQKAKNSISILNEQIQLTKDEIDYFDTLYTQMQNASFEDALEIKEELENGGYIKKHKVKGKVKAKKPHFETYLTKDNIELYLGKNNIQNDYLTFKFARKNYYWFHAKDMPGSHVVVASSELDEYTIRLAANIAAYYSKGKLSSSVPVNYTQIRTLKRPNHGKLGQVILDQYKTIYIDPDQNCLEELKRCTD